MPPPALWELELWELNALVEAENNRRRDEGRRLLAACWHAANFTGAAFAGKLRRLSFYLKDEKQRTAPKVSRDEFERRLAAAREGRVGDGPFG